MIQVILSAIIGSSALTAVIGWFIIHRLTMQREETARRDNASRMHLEAQIEQLYGPLLGLIQHSRIIFEVAAQKLPTKDNLIDFTQFSAIDCDIWHFFVESYFLPINARIRDLIRAKMHLLDIGILPKSFEVFFLHEVQFEALHRLWKEKNLDSFSVQGEGFPLSFEEDVLATLDKLRIQHQVFLKQLGATHPITS
jgi:hypothetical protein